MGGATASACILQTLAVTLAVQAPRITTAQTQELSGIATSAAPGGGASTPLPPGTTITLQLSGPDGFSTI